MFIMNKLIIAVIYLGRLGVIWTQTSDLFCQMARRTPWTLVLVVKCWRPNKPFNCCNMRMMAVPVMKPVIVECEKKSTNIPSLHMMPHNLINS